MVHTRKTERAEDNKHYVKIALHCIYCDRTWNATVYTTKDVSDLYRQEVSVE